MCSIRKLPLICVIALAGLTGGCGIQLATNDRRIDRLNDTPLVIDEAILQRDWDRSTAYYQASTVVAGPTWLTFRGDDKAERVDLLTDPFIFLANVAASPYAAFRHPQTEAVIYHGAIVPPTYHAMPPMP